MVPCHAQMAVQFVDVTAEAGITFRHINGASDRKFYLETMGSGAAFLDYDNDGDLDLYIVNGGPLPGFETSDQPTNLLYQNNGDSTFTDITAAAGVGDTNYGMGCIAADYDNDGDADLYVTNFGENLLYRNNGDGTFTDVTTHAGVGNGQKWSSSCAFVDYDYDGNLDLYVVNYLDYDIAKDRDWHDSARTADLFQSTGLCGHLRHPLQKQRRWDICRCNEGKQAFTITTAKDSVSPVGITITMGALISMSPTTQRPIFSTAMLAMVVLSI